MALETVLMVALKHLVLMMVKGKVQKKVWSINLAVLSDPEMVVTSKDFFICLVFVTGYQRGDQRDSVKDFVMVRSKIMATN